MKPRTRRWTTGLALACAAACADQFATEPQITDESRATRAAASGDVVRLLKRTHRLTEPMTAAAMIGPRGGRIQIPQAGIRVDFPRGAVARPTMITVMALPGRNVAYRFEPHGLVFEKPVQVRQSLRHTTAWSNPEFAAQLQGSYFERFLVDATESYTRSLERRAGKLGQAGQRLEFSIEHFSGYVVSTGKVESSVDVSIEIVYR